MRPNVLWDREVIEAPEGMKEDRKSRLFPAPTKGKELEVNPINCWRMSLGLIKTLIETYLFSRLRRCLEHFYRDIFSPVPWGKVKQVGNMISAHAQEQ